MTASATAGRANRRPCLDRLGWLALALALIMGESGCSRGESTSTHALMAPQMVAPRVKAAVQPNTLSREHSVVVDVPESQLEERFHRVAEWCASETTHHCTILQSDLQSGQTPSGLIKLRIEPTAVEDLVAFISALGILEHRATSVEDLADTMRDTQARIDMLTNYRKQLLALQAKAGANIDAAIKVAAELSTVQSDLEQANGEAAYQAKRVATDIVTIHFSVAEQRAYWRPVREALHDFLGNLSTAISQAITAVAFIIPWLVVLVPALYLLRFFWRRRRR